VKVIVGKIVFTFLFGIYCHATYAQEFDIVGLKLGMSVAQVHEALIAYGVDQKDIRENRQYYSYTDGVEQFQTDAFVTYINAFRNRDGSTDALGIFFSSSPLEGGVVAITREMGNQTNPTTRRQYLEALRNKYGQPTSEDISTVQWDFPTGKTQCIVGGVGTYGPAQPSILKKIYGANVGTRDGVLHNQKAKLLSDCASYLTYAMPSGDDSAVTRATAVMVDVAGTAEGELSANEWVAGLAEQARKVREARGKKPEL
tara:strand:- start:1490 stop:2260 length:771 start_codon:yes stop_codon:yes gene_type:complete